MKWAEIQQGHYRSKCTYRRTDHKPRLERSDGPSPMQNPLCRRSFIDTACAIRRVQTLILSLTRRTERDRGKRPKGGRADLRSVSLAMQSKRDAPLFGGMKLD